MSNIVSLIKKMVGKENHWKVELLENWPKLLLLPGHQVLIEAIVDQTLVLSVAHPIIAQQLAIQHRQILQKITNLCPDHQIKRLAFCTQKAPKMLVVNKPQSIKKNKPYKELQLSLYNFAQSSWQGLFLNGKELKTLENVCSQSLKKLLQKFYAKCKLREGANVQKNFENRAYYNELDELYTLKPIKLN